MIRPTRHVLESTWTPSVLVLASTIATALVLSWASGWSPPIGTPGMTLGSELGLLGWISSPLLAAGVVVAAFARWHRRGLPAVTVGSALLAVLTGSALVMFVSSESSTAGLMFASLPVLQWMIAIGTFLAAAWTVGRRGAATGTQL